MKKFLPLLVVLVCGLAFMTYYFKSSPPQGRPKGHLGQRIENELNEEDDPLGAIMFDIERTKDPALNTVPKERLIEAMRVRDERLAARALLRGPVSGINWQERGPSNVGGRTRTIMYDLRDAANGYKKVWAAGVGGGIWYTNDITAGPTWNKVNDYLGNIAVQTLAQSPANKQIMYAGTGEGWYNGDAIRGLGIWQSTDGGITWNQLPATINSNFWYVQKIVVTATGVVLAATRGGGIQRSADNGATWTKVLGAGVGGGTINDAADIEIAANDSVYCSMGIFSIGGIYRSANNGSNWNKIYNSANDENRIELALAPSNAERIYALVQSSATDGIKKIMTALDTATVPLATWVLKAKPGWCDQGNSSTDFTRGQAWYDLAAGVDPKNENVFYVGGVDCHKTTDGGATWTQISQWSSGCASLPYVHADIHNFIFRPDAATTPSANNEFLVGSDGGIFRTTNAGAAFVERNAGYNVTQFYSVAIHPTNGNYFLAGAQDNGTQRFTAAGINATTKQSGGDGGFTHIDQNEPNIQITAYTGNNYELSLDGGATTHTRIFPSGSFINPTDYDDAANILYGGYASGAYFRWNNPSTGGSSYNSVTVSGLGTISHVTVSPLTPNRVYFGSTNGNVSRIDSANRGTSRTRAIVRTGTGSVSCIAIDPADENHQLVTYSNFGVVSIFESKNATAATPTWSSVEGNLPDIPVYWAMFDPRNPDMAIIATDLGVWSTDDLNSGGTTDWQPTNTGLANVRTDMLQYRRSDRTIAAATHGRGLFTSTVPNTTTTSVNFITPVYHGAEATEGTIGCRRYKDYTVQIGTTNVPIGVATITLNVEPGGTAQQGVDYDFTTNGNFNSPSSSFTFIPGGPTTQNINVRVYDDAEVEVDEFFRLSYTISGASNAQRGVDYQTVAFNIRANDVEAVAGTFTVGTLDYYLDDPTASAPFDARLPGKRTQIIYKATELKAAGLAKGRITTFQLPLEKFSTRGYQNTTIKMGLTNYTSLYQNNTFNLVPTTVVKNAYTFTPTAGFNYNTFTLDTPFEWDGVSNLCIEICYNNGTSDPTNKADRIAGYLDGDYEEGNLIWQDTIDCSGAFEGSKLNYFVYGQKPQIRFGFTSATAFLVNSSATEQFGPNSNLNFYYKDSILARVRNLSAFDYGCTQVLIDRDGIGATPFLSTDPSMFLMNKTFRIIPVNNSISGSYQVTFYFTQAEVQGWQTATGQSFSNIQLVKVAGQVDNVRPNTPTGGGSIEVIAPSARGTLGTGYTLTATVNTGFSGFGFGIPYGTLPVTLLDFSGGLLGDNALLQWSTSTEQNSRHFEVEKSYDGVTYRKIGTIKAAGNSSSERRYSLVDKEFALDKNYYRLNIVDNDNKGRASNVVLIRNTKNKQGMFVINNPFNSHIDIRFGKVPQGRVKLVLTDLSGKQIQSIAFNGVAQNILRFSVAPHNLSKGIYLLTAEVDGGRYTSKVMKQ